MVDIKTAINELNTGKIEFDYKLDDCCTTPGEVVILLKRLESFESELAKAKKAFEIAVRCSQGLYGTRVMIEASQASLTDNRALNCFWELCLQKAREELKERKTII